MISDTVLVCSSLRVSDKMGILSWCTASVTLFSFCTSCKSSVPCNRNTRCSGALTINLRQLFKVRLIVKPVNRCIPNHGAAGC